MSLCGVIEKLKLKQELSKEDILLIFSNFKEKKVNDKDIEELIVLWNKKEHTVKEIFDLANVLNKEQNQKYLCDDAIDMCGTGGDKTNTFNISTLASIVASSCGAKVIKHSGRSTTSITGSVDILDSFGFNIDYPIEIKEKYFKKTNLMFVSSMLLREVFGDVKKVCKKLDVSGFVNLLGPLTNPYKTSFHLLGISKLSWGNLLAQVCELQTNDLKKEVLIVCSKISDDICLDELSFCGTNYLWHVVGNEIKKDVFDSSDFKVGHISLDDLTVKDLNENKVLFERLLKGDLKDSDPKASIVALNAGAALYLSKKVNSIYLGYELALQNINSGKAWEHLQIFLNCYKR